MEVLASIIYGIGASLRAVGRFLCLIGEAMRPHKHDTRWRDASQRAKERRK